MHDRGKADSVSWHPRAEHSSLWAHVRLGAVLTAADRCAYLDDPGVLIVRYVDI